MSNKEYGKYRPHYYAIKDAKNNGLYWMIPISSQTEKFERVIQKKIEKYGKCNTIIIGKFAGKQNAFLIQNAFPIISKYFAHVHVIENKPVQIHKELAKKLQTNLKDVLALRKRGINLFFADIDRIMELMIKEMEKQDKMI